METIGIILLAVIAYFLWKIYNQREEEKNETRVKAYDEEKEVERKELAKKYPHLIDNIEDTWLHLFGEVYIEKDLPFIKAAWMIYVQESTKIENPTGSIIFDTLWDLTEELLEHLEKYHKGNEYEFEIAIITYWQTISERAGQITKENPTTDGEPFRLEPFSDIQKIITWFPKKEGHPKEELLFIDKKTNLFPRESEGSSIIQDRMKKLGL